MKEPTQISWKELVGIFEDVRDLKSEQRFCFLLGAGASRSSDIPTGWELAEKWYKRIKELLSEEELKQWKEGLKNDKETIEFDEEKLGEFYTHIYERRFMASPGWDLQSHVDLAMENGHPNPKQLQKFADQITKE